MKNPFTNASVIGSGIDPDAYHRQDARRGDKDFVMTRSELMEFSTCPRRWLAGYGSQHDTESTEWGSLVDCMLLDPKRVDSKFAVCPATYKDEKTGEDKKWTFAAKVCKAWEKEQGGKTVVKSETFQGARTAVERLMDFPDIYKLLKLSERQVLIVADYHDRDAEITVPVKCLLDFVPYNDCQFANCLGDFKTTRSANPSRWGRVVNDFGYDVQAALYMDLHQAATGEERTDWIHLIQENVSPYEVLTPLPILSAEFIEQGRMKYQNALRRYAYALATGEWESYPTTRIVVNGFQIIEPEIWMIRQAADSITGIPCLSPITATVNKLTAPEFADVIP